MCGAQKYPSGTEGGARKQRRHSPNI